MFSFERSKTASADALAEIYSGYHFTSLLSESFDLPIILSAFFLFSDEGISNYDFLFVKIHNVPGRFLSAYFIFSFFNFVFRSE
jgi:hypothetical protein